MNVCFWAVHASGQHHQITHSNFKQCRPEISKQETISDLQLEKLPSIIQSNCPSGLGWWIAIESNRTPHRRRHESNRIESGKRPPRIESNRLVTYDFTNRIELNRLVTYDFTNRIESNRNSLGKTRIESNRIESDRNLLRHESESNRIAHCKAMSYSTSSLCFLFFKTSRPSVVNSVWQHFNSSSCTDRGTKACTMSQKHVNSYGDRCHTDLRHRGL